MKKLGAFLAFFAMMAQGTAFAWVGGPYSGNTYDGIVNGIFSGVIRGARCSGVFRFSQGETTFVNGFGDSVIYFRGMTYYGEAMGWIDTEGKTVSGVTNGANHTAGQVFDPSNQNLFRSVNNTGFGVYNGTSAGGNLLNLIATPRGAPGIANTMWNGKITSTRPSLRFKARGEASFVGDGAESSIHNQTAVTGAAPPVNIPPNPGDPVGNGTFLAVQTVNGFAPEVFQRIRIQVYGGRSSLFPATLPADYTGS